MKILPVEHYCVLKTAMLVHKVLHSGSPCSILNLPCLSQVAPITPDMVDQKSLAVP